jgi:hypothetical protein
MIRNGTRDVNKSDKMDRALVRSPCLVSKDDSWSYVTPFPTLGAELTLAIWGSITLCRNHVYRSDHGMRQQTRDTDDRIDGDPGVTRNSINDRA